jgi:hypothetical protein
VTILVQICFLGALPDKHIALNYLHKKRGVTLISELPPFIFPIFLSKIDQFNRFLVK